MSTLPQRTEPPVSPRRARPAGGRRISLKGKFVLAISSLVAVVLLANALVLVLTSRQQLVRDVERRAIGFADLAVRPICGAYETYYASGYGKFRELLTEVAALEPDLEGIEIYDTSGHRLFDDGEFELDPFAADPPLEKRTDDSEVLAALKGLEMRSWTVRGAGAMSFLVVEPYVEEWGRHRYSVVFRFSYESLRAALRAVAIRIGWLAAGSLTLGVLIAFLLASQSLGPVEELASGARDLAEGQLHRRLAITTGDEFEQLAGTFNQMAGRLTSTIADLEASNQALQRSNIELKELDRLKIDLLANVSHELRTPLTAIQGYAEALSGELLGGLNDAQRSAIEVMERNVQRLLGMINDLLSYVRLESRPVDLELRGFDLLAVANQVVGAVRASRGPDLPLALAAPRALPEVWGDSYRISQVIDNLLTNAVKFTPQGGTIELSLRLIGEEVEVTVADSGVGIPKEQQAKIFDRFYQVDSSSTRKYGGIGLGLAIVKQILDAHGTTMEVESEVERGSTLRFRLPLADAVRRRATTARATVALIDDDPEFCRTLSSFLSQRGYRMCSAGSLEAGLDLVREVEPDVILLDRLLPDGDGLDLLAQIKADSRLSGTPVLLVTVLKDHEMGASLGASGHLVKPVEPAVVQGRILQLLGSAAGLPPRVLIVEADEELRARLVDRLSRDGVRVRAVDSGLEALKAVEEEIPALLVLGLATKDLSGWELLRRLRKEKMLRTLPAIVLASGEGSGEMEVPKEIEVIDCGGRPPDLSLLVKEIERAVSDGLGEREP